VQQVAIEIANVVLHLEREKSLDPVFAVVGIRNLAHVGWVRMDSRTDCHLAYPDMGRC